MPTYPSWVVPHSYPGGSINSPLFPDLHQCMPHLGHIDSMEIIDHIFPEIKSPMVEVSALLNNIILVIAMSSHPQFIMAFHRMLAADVAELSCIEVLDNEWWITGPCIIFHVRTWDHSLCFRIASLRTVHGPMLLCVTSPSVQLPVLMLLPNAMLRVSQTMLIIPWEVTHLC